MGACASARCGVRCGSARGLGGRGGGGRLLGRLVDGDGLAMRNARVLVPVKVSRFGSPQM